MTGFLDEQRRCLLDQDVASSGFCCCNPTQTETLVVLAVSVVITSLLWYSTLFAPLKLIAVFLHEFSHASATWLTCGRVRGIEVNENYGGVTYSQGGERWFILSAGYTGSVVWGSFFILMTWDTVPTRIAAVVFIIAALGTACTLLIKVGMRVSFGRQHCHRQEKRFCGSRCAHGLLLRAAIVFVSAIPAGLWVLENHVAMTVHPLRWCMLTFGSVCTLHAVYDCLHDVLFHRIDDTQRGKSDAVMFANEIGGTPRCWGLLWSLVSLGAAGLAVFGVMVLAGKCTLL